MKNDEKVTKAKLYTYAEMKDAVAQAAADATANLMHDDKLDNPAVMSIMAMVIGTKIMAELDKRHEKGEL